MLIKLANVTVRIEDNLKKKVRKKIIEELGNYILPHDSSTNPDVCIYSNDLAEMKHSHKYAYCEVDEKYVKIVTCGPLFFTTNFDDKHNPVTLNIVGEKDIRMIWYFIENIIKLVAFYRYKTIFIHGTGFIHDNKAFCIVGPQRSGKTKILLCAAKQKSKVMNEDFIIVDKKSVYPYFPKKLELANHHFKQLERKSFLINYIKTKIQGDFSAVKPILVNIITKHARIRFDKIFSKDIIHKNNIDKKKTIFAILNPSCGIDKAYKKNVTSKDFISKSFEISYIEMSTFINILTHAALSRNSISLQKFLNDYHNLFFEVFSDVKEFKQVTYDPRINICEVLQILMR